MKAEKDIVKNVKHSIELCSELVSLITGGKQETGSEVTFPSSSPSTTSSWFRIHFLSYREKNKRFTSDSHRLAVMCMSRVYLYDVGSSDV